MTEPEKFGWAAGCILEYPTEVVMAWRGLVNSLLQGLKDRRPAARVDFEHNRIAFMFGINADSKEEAQAISQAAVTGILKDTTPLVSLTVVTGEQLEEDVYGPPDDLRERRKKRRTPGLYARRHLTSLGFMILERPGENAVYAFFPDKR